MNTVNKKFEIVKYWDKTPIEFKAIIKKNYFDQFNENFTKNKLHELKQITLNFDELRYSKFLLLLFHLEKVLIRLTNNSNEYVEISLPSVTNVVIRASAIKNLNTLEFKNQMEGIL